MSLEKHDSMDISLTEDQTMIAGTVRDILKDAWPRESLRSYVESGSAADDSDLWDLLADSEFHTIFVPEHLGGGGASVRDVLPALEELGYALAPTRFATSAVVSTFVLRSCEDSTLKRQLLDGTTRLCTVVTETLNSQVEGAAAVVGGTARFVPDVAGATHAVLVTPHLVGVVDLEPQASGVHVEPADLVDTTRRSAHLHFDSLMIDADHHLRTALPLTELMVRARRMALFTTVCDSLGGAQRALDMAVAYAKERRQFGHPIGSFQALQHLLADAYVAVENLRSATWYAGYALDQNTDDVDFAVLAASVLASTTYLQTSDLNIQVHGGMGFTKDLDAYLYAARAKVNELQHGSQAHRLSKIATWLRTADLEPLVDYLGGTPRQIGASMFAARPVAAG